MVKACKLLVKSILSWVLIFSPYQEVDAQESHSATDTFECQSYTESIAIYGDMDLAQFRLHPRGQRYEKYLFWKHLAEAAFTQERQIENGVTQFTLQFEYRGEQDGNVLIVDFLLKEIEDQGQIYQTLYLDDYKVVDDFTDECKSIKQIVEP